MNIIKFKDIVLNEENATQLTEAQRTLFNEKYRGRYTYAVDFAYIVALEDMTPEQYVNASKNLLDDGFVEDPASLRDFDYLSFDSIKDYVDAATTIKANSVIKYIEANRFHPDDNITVGELQNFRWWLAHELLELNADTEERYDVIEMLRYYEQNMYDDTVKHLTTFTPKTSIDVLTATNRSTCGCQGGAGVTTLASGLTVCDPIYTYRKTVYEKMVDTFSNIDFWTDQPVIFLEEFKKYIDGIIKMNFPLYTVDYISDLYDCGCLSNADSTQVRLIGYLKNLSQSLGYMIADDMVSHKNFIGDSFNKWAAYLYEKMSWI